MFKEKGFVQARKTRPAAQLNFATLEARVHLPILVAKAAADSGLNASWYHT